MYIHAIKKLCETPLSKHCTHTMDCTYCAMCVRTRQEGSTVPLTAVLNIMRWVVERLSLQFKHDALPVHSWRGSINSSSVTVTFFIMQVIPRFHCYASQNTCSSGLCLLQSTQCIPCIPNMEPSIQLAERGDWQVSHHIRGYVYVWLKTA